MRRSKVRMRRLKKEKESIGKRKNNEYGIKNNSITERMKETLIEEEILEERR